jgi:hypothetical protein
MKSKDELNVIFVHLGGSLPKYLVLNLDRFSKVFPEIPYVLIVNDTKMYLYCKKRNIPVFLYENQDALIDLYLANTHGKEKFRSNFWRFSLERLFAIFDFHRLHPSRAILHIESDVLVLPNFPWEMITQSSSLMWNSYSVDRDIASLLYSPSFEASKFLENELKKFLTLGQKHTDMSILRVFSMNHPEKVIYFNSSKSEFLPLKNALARDHESTRFKTRFLDGANGAFDSAANGIWLTGASVENNFGVVHLHQKNLENSAEIDPSDLEFAKDSFSNISISYKGKTKSLYSLHVHSKNERLFGPSWELELSKFIEMSSDKSTIKMFKPKEFIDLIAINYRRGELLLFLKLLIMHIISKAKTKKL